MKKLAIILLCLALAAALTACATGNAQPPAVESVPATQSPVTEATPADTQTPTTESAPTVAPQPAESTPTSTSEPPAQAEETISRDRAIELALTEAGLTKEEVRDLEAELDRERGGLFWEVDFESGGFEYSYDINATTEEVVTVERDRD